MASRGKASSGSVRQLKQLDAASITHAGTTKVYAGVMPHAGRLVSVGRLVTTGVTVAADTVTVTNETKSTTATYSQAVQAVNLGGVTALSSELACDAGDIISVTPGGLSTAGVSKVFVQYSNETV